MHIGKFSFKKCWTRFLYFTNALTESVQKALPVDIEPLTLECREKTVVLFRDETTFQSNEDQSLQWGLKGSKIMKPKSKPKVAGFIVSDFIDEHSGEEY